MRTHGHGYIHSCVLLWVWHLNCSFLNQNTFLCATTEVYSVTGDILRIASIALQTLRSRTRASAELWNVKPNRLLPVHQWWNVGFAFVYCRSFFSGQLSTTWHKNNTVPSNATYNWRCVVPRHYFSTVVPLINMYRAVQRWANFSPWWPHEHFQVYSRLHTTE